MKRLGTMGLWCLLAVVLALQSAPALATTTTTTVEPTTTTTLAPITPTTATGMRTLTGNTTLNPADGVVLVDTTAGGVTVTLPPVASGSQHWIKKVSADGNAVTVQVNGSEGSIIDGPGGASSEVTVVFRRSVLYISDGHYWWFVAALQP